MDQLPSSNALEGLEERLIQTTRDTAYGDSTKEATTFAKTKENHNTQITDITQKWGKSGLKH